ncbi:hypothetical protein AJ79_06130 [Helicocarpus griseus UAMH5409]|uniref:Uncharacterized protein n=1 Tax=Helicocarpus griseus UAMH5409 TaxID=1447875 RepID=A0A2B7XGT9_9EURO|nr:hypothetical protein AJ79_06130 [Helicocarpus griseus UAMH5409]
MENVREIKLSHRFVGNPNLSQYDVSSAEYAFVASATNLALLMLEHPRCKEVLATVAMLFDTHKMGSQLFQGNKELTHASVNWFLTERQKKPPLILTDENIVDIGCLAYHPRLP